LIFYFIFSQLAFFRFSRFFRLLILLTKILQL
jgi:hypothetical protein